MINLLINNPFTEIAETINGLKSWWSSVETFFNNIKAFFVQLPRMITELAFILAIVLSILCLIYYSVSHDKKLMKWFGYIVLTYFLIVCIGGAFK